MNVELRVEDLRENEKNIYRILNEHQEQVIRKENREIDYSFAIHVDKKYAGGITGRLWHDEFHISLLGVEPEFRGRGFSHKLMEAAEQAAINDGAKILTITTQDFQAIGLYLSCGYEVFGKLEDCPFEGTTRFYLKKRV